MKNIHHISSYDMFCTLILVFIALCSMPLALHAQVDLYGYFEPQYAGLYRDTSYHQSSYGKLRIDLHSTEIQNVRFGADIIYLNYFGKTSWNILEFLPDTITQSIPPEQQQYYQLLLRDTLYLDNAYVRMGFNRLALTIGKQQILFGTGYFSNPTDVFNTKDALDPTYEQPGHNAARIEIYPMSRMSITILYSPIAADWDHSGKLGRIKIGFGHFDISAIGYQFQYTSTDYYTFQQTTQQRTMAGGDIVGELLGFGVWGEGQYSIMEDDDGDSYEFLAGADYTFEGGLYTMVEYHHNSPGNTDYQTYDLNDWMRYISGEAKTLSRDQLYGLIQYPITDLVTIGSMGIYSISDQSAAIVPMMNYSLFANVDITVMLNIYTGQQGRTFNSKLGNGGFARAVVYF